MSNFTSQQLLEQFKKLPQDIQEAMFAVDTADTIMKIGQKYSLHVDKIGLLADEVGLIMLGLAKPSEFTQTIMTKLDISPDIANIITHEINQQIFVPIKDNLKKIHHVEGSANPQTATPAMSSQPYAVKPEKSNPVKEATLNQIENPSPANIYTPAHKESAVPSEEDSKPADALAQKMAGFFRIPKEELEIKKTDPYREQPQ